MTDVLAKYASEKAVKQRDPRSTRSNLANLIPFFTGKTVSQVNGALCRSYVEQRKIEASSSEVNHSAMLRSVAIWEFCRLR